MKKRKTPNKEKERQPPLSVKTEAKDFAPPTFKVERYLPLTLELDVEEKAKEEFLETLWNILVTITDLHMGIDPVQMLFARHPEFSTVSAIDSVESDSETTQKSVEVTADFNNKTAVLEES